MSMASDLKEEIDSPLQPCSGENLMYNPMLNKIILETVFQYLDVKELKICRLICHTWNTHVRIAIQRKGKCKLWGDCDEAPMNSNSLNSFFLDFYGESEIIYIPTKTFHIVNPGNYQGKRFLEIFGNKISSLILEFKGRQGYEINIFDEEDDLQQVTPTNEELQNWQINSLVCNSSLAENLTNLQIEHFPEHFNSLWHKKWAKTQSNSSNLSPHVLKCVQFLTLKGNYSLAVLINVMRLCPNVQNVHIVDNHVSQVSCGVFNHLERNSKENIQFLTYTKCQICVETLKTQKLCNVTQIIIEECFQEDRSPEINSSVQILFNFFRSLTRIKVINELYDGTKNVKLHTKSKL